MTPARQLFDQIRAQTPPPPLRVIAEQLQLSKAAIVAYSKGNYAASVEHIETKILARYGAGADIDCPHLSRPITRAECAAFHTRRMPTGSPASFQHWRACQRCAQNPNSKA